MIFAADTGEKSKVKQMYSANIKLENYRIAITETVMPKHTHSEC